MEPQGRHFAAWLAYIAGPLLGGALGALAYEYLIRRGEPPQPAGAVDEQPKET